MISKSTLKLLHKLEQKKHRHEEGLFVAEGPKVVADLLCHGYRPVTLIATGQWLAGQEAAIAAVPATTIIEASPDELQRASFLQHPQQVMALFPIPPAVRPTPQKGHLYMALDGVQDPGNLGTIVRIADWFGIDTIFCSEYTVDVWSPKVIQATMGSIARVSVVYTSLTALLSSTSLPVYGTLLDGHNIYQQALSPDGIIVMGNEGNGISAAVRPLVSKKLLIPDYSTSADKAESLNVAIATAITCSEFRRRF